MTAVFLQLNILSQVLYICLREANKIPF
jgi:hypothetical protein